MGLLDEIRDTFKPIVNAISTVLKNTELVTALMPLLAVAIPPPWDLVAVVSVMALSAVMGVKEDPEKLGAQMQEADKGRDDFDSFKDYKKYLDENYPFDQKKFDAQTETYKQACRYVGIAGTLAELKEEKGFNMTPQMLGLLTKGCGSLGMDKDATANLASNMARIDDKIFTNLGHAINDKLDPDTDDKLMADLKQALNDSNSKVTDPNVLIGAMSASKPK